MADEYLVNSCLALQSVSASIQTMLGPNKSLKCYLSANGDSGILGDSMQVLDALMASYRHHGNPKPGPSSSLPPTTPLHCPPPSLQLLHEYCREYQTRVGCGTTTLVCLSAFWASEILDLAQQGVPLLVVFAMLREVLYKCEKFLSQLSISLPRPASAAAPQGKGKESTGGRVKKGRGGMHMSRKQARVLSFSRHFGVVQGRSTGNEASCVANSKKTVSEDVIRSVGERLGRGRELAMRLAVEARLLQDSTPLHPPQEIQVPLQYCVVGKAEEHSRLVRGVVTDLHPDMLSVASGITTKKLNVLVLEGDCSPHWKHLGLQRKAGHVTSHDLSLLYEQSSESKWLAKSTTTLETFHIDVLVVGGTVWPLLWQWCSGVGMLVLKEVSASIRTALARMTGLRPLSYLTQCSVESVGGDVAMEVLEAGWVLSKSTRRGDVAKSHCCRLFKAPPPSSCSHHGQPVVTTTTAILCGLTECQVDALRHQLTNSAHRLHWATTPTTENMHGNHTHQPLPLLPGNGQTEAAIIRMLESEVSKLPDMEYSSSSRPLYFTRSWMSLPHVVEEGGYRVSTYQAFAGGLRRYLTHCLINAKPGLGQFEARSQVEEMIRDGGRIFGHKDDKGTRESEVDLLASERGGDNAKNEGANGGVDVFTSKLEAWKKAVQLLEFIFLLRKVGNAEINKVHTVKL